mgnify:CR=1 FL=1
MGLGLLACQPPESLEQYSGSSEADKVSVDRITYVNSAGDVFTIKDDGSERQQLTGGTQVSSGPVGPFMGQGIDFDNFHAWPTWSPDGTKFVFEVNNSNNSEIYLFDLNDSRNPTNLTNLPFERIWFSFSSSETGFIN